MSEKINIYMYMYFYCSTILKPVLQNIAIFIVLNFCCSIFFQIVVLVWFFVYYPGKQFFSHFGTEPLLPGYLPVLWEPLKCLAQGHHTVVVGFEPWTSLSGVRCSTTEIPQPPLQIVVLLQIYESL